jgi:hypothetical protein
MTASVCYRTPHRLSIPFENLANLYCHFLHIPSNQISRISKGIKMIDPQLVADSFKKTTTTMLPFPPTTTSVAPIPKIIPDVPPFEKIGGTGTKTLWVRQNAYNEHKSTI